MESNLTNIQLDENGLSKYAIFLPATSNFFATFIGKQRYNEYVDLNRIPKHFKHGVESLNYLDPKKGLFYYKWCLYSAGHAKLDLNKFEDTEDMFRNRDRSTSFVLGDSGGFQIGKLVWQADWLDPTCPNAQKKREQVLTWMDALMDWGMCLDIPAWVARNPESQKATGITSYKEALQGTFINNDYFINNRNGNCKFLNVLQGENHREAKDWYQQVKKYCDPRQYGDRAFNGWGMGGQRMCSPTLVMKTIIDLREDQLLERGYHDWMHFLGTSKLEWSVFLTAIQRAVRKYHNSNFTISFDCASPFLASANGQLYINNEFPDRKKWVYRMTPTADDKKYATDSRLFKDAVLQDKLVNVFQSSPVIDQCKISDICIYKPGDLNKIGREGKTSWDSFSYAIQMGHNVWAHISAVQKANQLYDQNKSIPAMLINEKHGRIDIRDIIDEIMAADTGKAYKLIDKYDRYLSAIIGTRGYTGKREVNANTYFNMLFDEITDSHSEDFTDEEFENLEQLENQQV